jgi:hypothetical protein
MKTRGANIFCSVCRARPYADIFGPPGARVDFDLMRLDGQGRPSESPAPGNWYCSKHYKALGGGKYRVVADE